jgi:hypothetical protein
MVHGWAIAKDSASLAGALLISCPWFGDFFGRSKIKRAGSIDTGMKLREKIIQARRDRLSDPKLLDLVLTSSGLVLLIGSFLVALLQSLGILPG